MAMTGFICHDDYLKKTEKLADEELGRLFRACMTYHATGEVISLEGRESVAFDFIKEDIDRAEQAYTNKCEQNRRNRNARNDNERKRALTGDDERTQEQEQEQKQEKEEVVVNDPLTLTAAEITAAIDRDNQIEGAARDVGLQVSAKAMLKARDLADQYGLDELLKAISASVDVPKWAYVEGILRNGGVQDGNRNGRNSSVDTKNNASPYAFLRERETAI